jgi:hypothetical protein
MTMTRVEPTYVFPPALVRVVRERLTSRSRCLSEVTDNELDQLLTTIFFAGLETYEGEHNPIAVTFLGRRPVDFVMTEAAVAGAPPLYRWKILRFASPRPLATRELVKLAAGVNRRIYSAVAVLDDGALAITGLAREGVNAGPDPFIKIVAARPGCLSIRSGRDLAIEYERGVVLTLGDDEVFSAGPVHRALEAIAHGAGVEDEVVPHYLDVVGFLVREIAAHGHGGILIISPDQHPSVAESAPYRMSLDSSLAALLRLAWRIRGKAGDGLSARSRRRELRMDSSAETGAAGSENLAFRQLLHSAFLTEAERVVEELGGTTAIDGAVLLNRDLALVAFGLILPVRQQITVAEAATGEDGRVGVVDLASRGTRHRASATYAEEHPGSVVFVASEDGQVSCMFREQPAEPVRLWRLGAGTAHIT